MEIEDLDPSILQRVPIRSDDNQYYFPKIDIAPKH